MEKPLESWERIRLLIDEGDDERLDAFLRTMSGTEVLRALFRLSEDEQRTLLLAVPPASAADIIEDVPDEHAADLLEGLPAADVALILDEMAPDEQADVLAAVEESELDAILEEMSDENSETARELLTYDPEVAGGLMVRECLRYGPAATASHVLGEVISGIRDMPRQILQHAYVIDAHGMLLGVVRLRDLVSKPGHTRLQECLRPAGVVNHEMPLELLRVCFEETEELSLPVTTDEGQLRGVLLRVDVETALAEKERADHLKSQGIIGGEELRTMGLRHRSGRRLSWLSLNILLNVVAASVIAAFEDTLTAVIALAVFLPIVSDMSGCSGNQAVAVSMRELTLGVVNVRDVMRVWWQEAQVGLINGLALGVLLGLAGYLWKGNVMLGIVVGGALAINTLVAVSLGGTVPLLLKRYGADPAVASGPILTTVTDMCGFFLVLGFATLALPYLQVN